MLREKGRREGGGGREGGGKGKREGGGERDIPPLPPFPFPLFPLFSVLPLFLSSPSPSSLFSPSFSLPLPPSLFIKIK